MSICAHLRPPGGRPHRNVGGADRVRTMDLHSPQIQGFFSVPVDNLVSAPVLVGLTSPASASKT